MSEQCQEQGTIDKGWATKHVYLRTASRVWDQYILARANHNEAMYILSWSPNNAIKSVVCSKALAVLA